MSGYLRSCKTEFWSRVLEKELHYIVKELKGSKDILSVGCGPAIIEAGLKENGFVVTGLDISEEALEQAPNGIRAIVGQAEDMRCFEGPMFDAVIYVASLQFIDGYEKAVKETARVLRPGGKLLVMLLNPESGFYMEKRREPGSYVSKIRHTDLGAIVAAISHHFEIVKTEYFLGIRGKETFETRDPASAALYIVHGRAR